jgi:hypothetical protein
MVVSPADEQRGDADAVNTIPKIQRQKRRYTPEVSKGVGAENLCPNRVQYVRVRRLEGVGEPTGVSHLLHMVFRLVLSPEERKAIEELEKVDDGFVQSFRNIIRQLVNIFVHSHSESQVKRRLKQLRTDIGAAEDKHLDRILQFLDNHWDPAFAYLRKRGMGKHRRGSNSESGMRLLRRLEKNHDGIWSATTRQHYIQIYQAIKYLSLDIAEFVDKGLRIKEVQSV